MDLRDYSNVKDRREALEEKLQINLSNIGNYSLDEKTASGLNCENMIGVSQIPIGIAGPLKIRNKEYFIPLSTTEGALVASVNRGCKAVTESGGAEVSAFRFGATRGLVFYTENIEKGVEFAEYVYKNKSEFNKIAETISSHIQLTDIVVKTVGQFGFVRFAFDTKDAMGMNMVTIASDEISKLIAEKTKTRCISLAGNYDVDKKPSWLNFIRGRGWEVRADVILSENVLKTVLKTTARNVYETWLAKCMIGSAMSGAMGFNAHYANVIAAIFVATGQDIAHVVEGSLGITTAEVRGEDLYVSIYLPDLMVGTVGGGTTLATQKESLSILQVKESLEFAEVIGGAVLTGEISLISSLSEGSLASAHKELGRGGK